MSACLIPRVGVGSVSSPLEVGANRAPQAAKDLAALLANCGCEVVDLGPVDSPVRATAAGRLLAEQHVHQLEAPAYQMRAAEQAVNFLRMGIRDDVVVFPELAGERFPNVLFILDDQETSRSKLARRAPPKAITRSQSPTSGVSAFSIPILSAAAMACWFML